MKPSYVVAAIFGLSIGLFQFWPFTLAFLLVGGLASLIVDVMVGHMVSFALVLLVEYMLMLAIFFMVWHIKMRKRITSHSLD